MSLKWLSLSLADIYRLVCLVKSTVTPKQVSRCWDLTGRTGSVGKYTSVGVWVLNVHTKICQCCLHVGSLCNNFSFRGIFLHVSSLNNLVLKACVWRGGWHWLMKQLIYIFSVALQVALVLRPRERDKQRRTAWTSVALIWLNKADSVAESPQGHSLIQVRGRHSLLCSDFLF